MLGGVAVLVAGLGLAGCSSPLTGMLGIRVVDGEVQSIVEMCPGYTSSRVEMGPRPLWNIFNPLPAWDFAPSRTSVVSMGSVDEIVALVGDGTLWAGASASEGVGGLVRFTAEDITALQPGDILISPKAGHEPVDQVRFDLALEQLCSNLY